MIKVKILTIGKHKHAWLESALKEYEERLKHYMAVEWILAKNDEQLLKLAQEAKNCICLDPKGMEMTSEAFTAQIEKLTHQKGAILTFCIGGAEGLPLTLKSKALAVISLSKLTFTHQMTRLILLEQLYRSKEIAIGSEYHK